MLGILFILALCVALGLQCTVTVVIIALRAKGSKERLIGAFFQGGLCLCLIFLFRALFPIFFFKIIAVNLLPGVCFTCVYFLLSADIADRGSTPLPYLLFQSVRLFQDVCGVEARKSKPKLSAYRAKFFRTQATHFALCLAIPELVWLVARYILHGDSWEHGIERDAEFLFFESTSSQLLARLTATIGFWVMVYSLMDAIHRFVSILSVASGYSRPQEWTDLFGSVREAYSIRGFWGLVSICSL